MDTYSIADLLKAHRPSHSNLQMEWFITCRSGITTYGKFKQATREFATRYSGLKSNELQRLRLVNKQERLAARFSNGQIENIFDRRDLELDLFENASALEDLEKTAQECLREFNVFYEQCCYYRFLLPATLDEQTIDRLEEEMWTAKLKLQMAIDLRTSHNVAPSTLEAIYAMPKKPRLALLAWLESGQQELLDWAKSVHVAESSTVSPPSLELRKYHLTMEQVRKTISM